MTELLILASLAATFAIIIAMHDMEENAFVIWLHVLFFGWCGGGVLAIGLLA